MNSTVIPRSASSSSTVVPRRPGIFGNQLRIVALGRGIVGPAKPLGVPPRALGQAGETGSMFLVPLIG
jgi:hypothetical protein